MCFHLYHKTYTSSAHKWQGFNHLSLKMTRSSSSPSRAAWRMYGIRPGAQGTKGDTDKGPAALSFRQKGGLPKNTTSCQPLGISHFCWDFCWKKMGGGVFSSRVFPHLTFPNPDTTATRGKELKSDILRQKIHQFRLVTFFSQEMPWVFWWLARWISQYTFRKIFVHLYGENIFEGLLL